VDKPCKKACGAETRVEMFEITQQPTDGSMCSIAEGKIRETDCDHPECVDCQGGWSSDKTCGCGINSITEIYSIAQSGNGAQCPFSSGETREKECPKQQCQHCEGLWVEGECDRACGTGKRTDVFKITTNARGSGKECGAKDGDIRSVSCTLRECKKCVGEWEKEGGSCNQVCGAKSLQETFHVSQEGEREYTCTFKDEETRTHQCPVKKECQACEGEWVTKQACTKMCGSENKVETFKVSQFPTDGGTCAHDDGEVRKVSCGNPSCRSCKGDWELGTCSQTCGSETRKDVFRVTQESTDGSSCTYTEGEVRESSCNHPQCTTCSGTWKKEKEQCDHMCGVKKVEETYRILTEGNDGNGCSIQDGETRMVNCPKKVPCESCKGVWEKGRCTQTCGEEMRTDTFNLVKDSTNGSVCPYKNGELRSVPCNHQPCIECKGEWNAQPCTKKCGTETVQQTFKIIEEGNTGTPCPYVDGEEKPFECALPSCLTRLKREICHPYDSICLQTKSYASFCEKMNIPTCTVQSIKNTVDEKCEGYGITKEDCNYTRVAKEEYHRKAQEEIQFQKAELVDITLQKAELVEVAKKMKRREKEITSKMSTVNGENQMLRQEVKDIKIELEKHESSLRLREQNLLRLEKKLARQQNKQDEQKLIEEDAWEMLRQQESRKANMVRFVDETVTEKPYLENLCALTSGRNIPRYECKRIINTIGQNCSEACFEEFGGEFSGNECKTAVQEFNDLKVTCQLFSAIFSPDKLTSEEKNETVNDPLYAEVQSILSIADKTKTDKTKTFICGNPDLDRADCKGFGLEYDFPTVYKNGVCEMTAIQNEDECQEFSAEAEGFDWNFY